MTSHEIPLFDFGISVSDARLKLRFIAEMNGKLKIYSNFLLTCRNKSRNFGEPNLIWRAAFLSLIF